MHVAVKFVGLGQENPISSPLPVLSVGSTMLFRGAPESAKGRGKIGP